MDGYNGELGNYAISVPGSSSLRLFLQRLLRDDSYLEIRFSEDMYTNATGEGAVEPSDLK